MDRARWLKGTAACALLMALTGCLGGGGGSGGGSGGSSGGAPWQGLFNVPNIYVKKNAKSVNDIEVERAVVFGDSYSAHDTPLPYRQWNEQALDSGLFRSMSNYAVPGAEAADPARSGKSLRQQVDNFLANDSYTDDELTLIFIGFNDIRLAGSLAEMDAAEADAQVEFDRLEQAGATGNERRVFLMLSPNYGRYPNVPDPSTRTTYTLDWANFLTDYGNAHVNFVPVDLFTFFERVFNEPSRFGLTNVTTSDPANAVGDNATALFYDNIHFGDKGHALIAALVEHYLSEGWDWANTLTHGSDTVAQLNRDIDNGLITAFARADERGEALFAFGTAKAEAPAAVGLGLRQAAGARTFGVGWRLSPTLGVALVQGRDTTAFRGETAGAVEGGRSDLRLGGVALVQDLGAGWNLDAALLWSREELERRRFDSFTASAVRGGTEVAGTHVRARLSGELGLGGAWLQPWAGFVAGERRVDGYAMSDPYVGTVRFGAVTLQERMLEAGARLAVPLARLGEGRMWLQGDVRLEKDLGDDSVVLRITQGRFPRRERVSLPDRSSVQGGLGLRYAAEALSTGVGYAFAADAGGRDHRIGFDLTWRFPVR